MNFFWFIKYNVFLFLDGYRRDGAIHLFYKNNYYFFSNALIFCYI